MGLPQRPQRPLLPVLRDDRRGAPVAPARPSAEAIKALEEAGILSWVNRITRIRERCADLFGHLGTRWRVIRTSNAYHFNDPQGRSGRFPVVILLSPIFRLEPRFKILPLLPPPPLPQIDPENPLEASLKRLGLALGATHKKAEPLRGLCTCATCAPSGRGRTDAQARRKEAMRGRSDGGEIAPYRLRPCVRASFPSRQGYHDAGNRLAPTAHFSEGGKTAYCNASLMQFARVVMF